MTTGLNTDKPFDLAVTFGHPVQSFISQFHKIESVLSINLKNKEAKKRRSFLMFDKYIMDKSLNLWFT